MLSSIWNPTTFTGLLLRDICIFVHPELTHSQLAGITLNLIEKSANCYFKA